MFVGFALISTLERAFENERAAYEITYAEGQKAKDIIKNLCDKNDRLIWSTGAAIETESIEVKSIEQRKCNIKSPGKLLTGLSFKDGTNIISEIKKKSWAAHVFPAKYIGCRIVELKKGHISRVTGKGPESIQWEAESQNITNSEDFVSTFMTPGVSDFRITIQLPKVIQLKQKS